MTSRRLLTLLPLLGLSLGTATADDGPRFRLVPFAGPQSARLDGTLVRGVNLGEDPNPKVALSIQGLRFDSRRGLSGFETGTGDFSPTTPAGTPIDRLLSGGVYQPHDGRPVSLELVGLVPKVEYRLQVLICNGLNTTGREFDVRLAGTSFHVSRKHPAVILEVVFVAHAERMSLEVTRAKGGEATRAHLSAYLLHQTAGSHDPLPNPSLQMGVWGDIKAGHALIPIKGYVLDWVRKTGDYRLWSFDPTKANPLVKKVQQGRWATLRTGRELVPVGDYVLDWVPRTGDYRLWSFDPTQADPLAKKVQQGTWSSITTGHRLLALPGHVLDWVPKTGEYRLWTFDPTQEDPLAKLAQKGTWSAIGQGRELVPFGGYVMDWEPSSGAYRLWRVDPKQPNPLVGPPVTKGAWATIRDPHVLFAVGDRHALEWKPPTGQYRVWRFQP